LAAWLDRVHPLVGIFPHQMRLVGRAVLTKDGKTAVTIGEDQCFLWDTARSELRVPPLKHADAIYSVALDSEGRFLVTASADGTACIWDVSTGQRRGSPLQHPKPVKRASFDRQGTRVITVCADKVVRLWNVADGALLEPALAHDYDVSDAIVTRDGQFVFTSTNDKKAYLWSTADGACVRKWECVEGYPVSAISPDGQSIALATGANALKCYTPQGELRWEHRNLPLSQISAIRFSPGGERLLTVSQDFSMSKESTAQLWRADTGKSLAPPSPHANLAVFNPDGHFILTGSDDTTARVRDAGTGLTIGLPLHHQGAVRAISVSGDGDLILTASWDSKARLWRRSTFALPKGFEHDEKVWAAVFDPIHRTLVTAAGKPFGSGSAQIWNLETGQREGSPLRQDSLITVLSVSPGGTSLATGGDSGGTRIWDLSSGQESARIQETGLVSAVVFLPDGRRLLTGSLHDKKVRVWDIPSRAQIGTSWEHPQEVTAVAISPKADLAVTGCADRRARLWHVEGGTLVREFLHLDWVNAVAYCPDGKRIGTGSSDRTAAIWDATNGKQLFSLRHPDVVRTIAFSPNGKILATGCHDGYARLWDVATGLLLGPPFPLTSRLVDGRWIPSRVWTVAFSPDGTQLFCGGDDKIGRLWPVPRPLEGSVADIVRHIKVITGMELDDAGAARDLPDDVWRQLKAADAFH
jgi:WD40 repeat protein